MAILITPVTTEKAFGQSQKNIYVFNVPTTANKQQILETVEKEFGVTVKAIKTLVQSGKAIRFSRGKNRYPGSTTRSDSKKAYVTLAAGDSIKIFDQPEEPKAAAKAEKKEKK
jgi:large subunit ribosomal protein L23